MEFFSLKDKVAVVTGAGSGLGYATAKRFADAGAKVVMADINDKTASLAADLGALFIRTDVSKEGQVEALMQGAAKALGPLDIVVNNAGIISPEELLGDTNPETFRRLMDVNLMGVVFGIKYAQKYMNDGGAILNTASNSANGDYAGYGAYIASKAAVVGVTKAAAIELAPRGIRVNCICPQHHRHPHGLCGWLRDRTSGHEDSNPFGQNVQTGRSRSPVPFPGGRRLPVYHRQKTSTLTEDSRRVPPIS